MSPHFWIYFMLGVPMGALFVKSIHADGWEAFWLLLNALLLCAGIGLLSLSDLLK
jgi:hypothetical protein